MIDILEPDWYSPYKLCSEDDACVEVCHNTEYTYEQAVRFVKSLGYIVLDHGNVEYDAMFKDWRGYVNVDNRYLPQE